MANIYQKQCSLKVDLQSVVRSLESSLVPVERLLLISWLTEVLDWDTRRLLLYQLSLDWSSDLAQDLKEILDNDDEEELVSLQVAMSGIRDVLEDNLRSIDDFLRQTDARSKIPKEKNPGRSR